MKKKMCLDCETDISDRRFNAKRCSDCQRKRVLNIMKKYRETHKKEISEYQKVYYGKK